MSKHALLSASGASRWLECTPSAKLEATFPATTSMYAEEGTAAHELAELAARYWFGEITEADYEAQLETLSHGKYYNAEMLEHAIEYAKLVYEKVMRARTECPDALVELEVRVDYSNWAKSGFGTGDCVIVADNWLEIVDYKYGKGYRVDAFGNPQMKLYALGAYAGFSHLYDIENIRMTIFQPRLIGGMSTHELSINELLDWGDNYVKPRAKLAYSGTGKFAPSDIACKFCKAKEQCRARTERNLKLFDDTPDALLLTPDEAGVILEQATDIKAWLTDLENLVTKTLFAGEAVSGWKLVEGRSNRAFADETLVVDAMKAAGYAETVLYERKLIPLTQMEKDFGKKAVKDVLADLIIKPPGKPKLAAEADKRPAIVPDDLLLAAFDEAADEVFEE